MNKTLNLFLVEHSSHVNDLLSRNMRNKGEWVALGPGAMCALEREGIYYKIPEDFCSNEEMGKLCLIYHDKMEKFCNFMDELLYEKYPELKEWGMQPFLFHIFPLTMLVDGMVSRIFQIRNILNAYLGYKVWVYKAGHYPWGDFDITFSNRETLWGHVLSLQGWDCEVEFLEESKPRRNSLYFAIDKVVLEMRKISEFFVQKIKKFIKKSFILYNSASHLKLMGLREIRNAMRKKPERVLLFYNDLYEWRWVLSLLRDKNWRIIFAGETVFKRNIPDVKGREKDSIENLIRKGTDVMSVFEVCGISFYSLLQERLTWIFENSFLQCKNIISQCSEIVSHYNVKAICTANTPVFTDHVLEQASRYFYVPVIRWQHGFMIIQNGRINQLSEFNNMLTSDVVFTFGEEPTHVHELYLHKFCAKVVSIGSSSLDKIWKKSIKRKDVFRKTILYVTTDYYHNRWYNGFYPPFSDRYLFKDQLTIMESLKQMIHVYHAKVTVKLPRASYFDLQFINDFSSLFRIVIARPSFTELMCGNHIIIIDSPTTTVLQAVATKKPIFVLMRHIGYPDSARKILEKRAVCVDNSQQLINAIKCYIEQKTYPADVNNDEFLKAYGTYLNDGASDKRVVGKVLEMISENQ